MTESNQHEDVYFKYMIDGGDINHTDIFRIDKFKLNQEECKFESDKTFMYGRPYIVSVYACKEDEKKFKPWLLQLVGYYYDNSSNQTYCNYFFKLEDGKNWKNESFISLNVPSGSSDGSIQPKQNEEAKDTLKKTFKALQSSDVSLALGYEYKNSSGSTSSIEPNKLPDYLSESDKNSGHSTGEWSQSYKFTSLSSGSVENISFEITIKRRPNKETENTLIYELKKGSTSQIKPKSSTTSTNLSGSGSCKVTQSKEAVGSNGQGGSTESGGDEKGSGGSSGEKKETGESGGENENGSNPSHSQDSQDSGLQSTDTSSDNPASEASSGETEKSTSPSESSPAASKSSSNIPWILGGAVIGFIILIGVGIFIYKRIR
ncbi:hypothetical protein BdWA1_002507 [Babesia duncani]|uniref:Uncharacterized protein n=1 Tax=Babesia duncani TaxID=323732 RepID=A0AAD9UNI0_9APIC|nr:hypothetical protein BdWA1_002507 [Babesia duncani]